MLATTPAALGADLEVDLFRLELDDRLTHLDAIAFLLEPPRDARFDDRLAQLRNDDVRHDCGTYTCFDSTIDGTAAWLPGSKACSTSAF